MPTKNIECQLAQGQIGRYLNGERFSPIAIEQLEAHVGECEECTELVSRRRQVLIQMLGEGTTHAAVMTDAAPNKSKADLAAERLKSVLGKKQEPELVAPVESKTKLLIQTLSSKPILYGAALAAVLIAVSYFGKTAIKTFGPTADSLPTDTISVKAPQAQSSATVVNPAANTSQASSQTAPTPAAVVPAPTAKEPSGKYVKAPSRALTNHPAPIDDTSDTPVAQPTPVAAKKAPSAHRRLVRKPVSHRLKARSHSRLSRNRRITRRLKPRFHQHTAPHRSSTIRVYDAQGQNLRQ